MRGTAQVQFVRVDGKVLNAFPPALSDKGAQPHPPHPNYLDYDFNPMEIKIYVASPDSHIVLSLYLQEHTLALARFSFLSFFHFFLFVVFIKALWFLLKILELY